jgi:hypothetical protein
MPNWVKGFRFICHGFDKWMLANEVYGFLRRI